MEIAKEFNIKISGRLQVYVESQIGENGLFDSVNEYVRALIRRDIELETALKDEDWLHQELLPALNADESDYLDFNPQEIIDTAKRTYALVRFIPLPKNNCWKFGLIQSINGVKIRLIDMFMGFIPR